MTQETPICLRWKPPVIGTRHGRIAQSYSLAASAARAALFADAADAADAAGGAKAAKGGRAAWGSPKAQESSWRDKKSEISGMNHDSS